jgi:hypothetical protein
MRESTRMGAGDTGWFAQEDLNPLCRAVEPQDFAASERVNAAKVQLRGEIGRRFFLALSGKWVYTFLSFQGGFHRGSVRGDKLSGCFSSVHSETDVIAEFLRSRVFVSAALGHSHNHHAHISKGGTMTQHKKDEKNKKKKKDSGELTRADVFSLASLIRDESRIEISFWNDRKNEVQFVWMGCVAGSALALESDNPLVFLGIPLVLGMINTRFARSCRDGLKRSLNEINNRHQDFIDFIYEHEILNKLGFSRVRKVELGNGEIILEDPVHHKKKGEFGSIFTLVSMTTWVTLGFLVLGLLKLGAIIFSPSGTTFWELLARGL